MSAQRKVLSQVVDVQKVDANNPLAAIRTVSTEKIAQTLKCDILIAGGGMGGVAAALAALEKDDKLKVVMLEETDWIGGQMTQQGVSAFDENKYVETSGACRRYQLMRESIRHYYSTQKKLSTEGKAQEYLNPGNCWVSRLSFEPAVGVSVLQNLLKPYEDNGRVSTFLRYKVVAVSTDVDHGKTQIKSVDAQNLDSGDVVRIQPHVVVDATELGDLLPLASLPYSSGSDSKSDTGERHAPDKGDPQNVQDFTYPFLLEYRPGEKHPIAKPDLYDEFVAKGKFSLQGYKIFEQAKNETGYFEPFWTYRRLVAAENFEPESYQHDLSMINWDSNDLRLENIIDQAPETEAKRLAMGKLVSLGFLYWLQNEVERDDGGKGYPEFKLITDALGTTDGLSLYPYIREARRIKAIKQIVESDIVAADNSGPRAANRADSVGIGLYPVDIHGHQEVPGAGQETKPFQIPLSSLIPSDAVNLLPACKNIGTTHITNGAYRLHPIEWAIGEAQGTLAARMLKHGRNAAGILNHDKQLCALQNELTLAGVPLFWYDDVPTSHENFAAIQFLSVLGLISSAQSSLSFAPDKPLTQADAWTAAAKLTADHTQVLSDVTADATIDFLRQLRSGGCHPFHHIKGEGDTKLTRAAFCQLIVDAVRQRFCHD